MTKTVCNAKRKWDGEQCTQPVVPGKTKCRWHGGKTPGGIASPAFKDGRYSKYMPKRLLDRYQASLEDPKALAQRHELALVEARIEDLMKRVDGGESSGFIKDLRKMAAELEAAWRSSDSAEISRLTHELIHNIKVAHSDYRAWDDVHKWTMARNKLVESERKRQVESKQTVSIDEMMTLVSALTEVLRRHVTDMRVLNAVTTDIGRLINHGDPDSVEELSPN